MSARPIGVVTGLKREAALLRKAEMAGLVRVALSGADPARAEAAAEQLAENGVAALLSFGLCGALEADVRAGDLLLPTHIVWEGEGGRSAEMASDPLWRARLQAALPDKLSRHLHVGRLLGSDRLESRSERKLALGQSLEALAIDMESHAVARVAQRRGLPFLALRACSDQADQDLPAAVEHATKADGSLALTPLLTGLASRPASLAGLLSLARSSKLAMTTLREVVASAPGFCFSDGPVDR